jgi:tetratricopeptide (TPR) repeat protein
MCSPITSHSSAVSRVPLRRLSFVGVVSTTVSLFLFFQIGASGQEPWMGAHRVNCAPERSLPTEPSRLSPPPSTLPIEIDVPSEEKAARAASVTVSQLSVPGKAQKVLRKAWDAMHKGQTDVARSEVAEALAIWPRYSDAIALSAILYLVDHKPDSASAAAEEAVSLDSANGMAYIVLAAARNSKGEYDEALRALESGLRFRPDAWQAYFERARAEIGKREFATALADANRAGELASRKTSAIHFLKAAALLNLSRTSDAVVELQAYLRMNPVGPAAEKARVIIENTRSTP